MQDTDLCTKRSQRKTCSLSKNHDWTASVRRVFDLQAASILAIKGRDLSPTPKPTYGSCVTMSSATVKTACNPKASSKPSIKAHLLAGQAAKPFASLAWERQRTHSAGFATEQKVAKVLSGRSLFDVLRTGPTVALENVLFCSPQKTHDVSWPFINLVHWANQRFGSKKGPCKVTHCIAWRLLDHMGPERHSYSFCNPTFCTLDPRITRTPAKGYLSDILVKSTVTSSRLHTPISWHELKRSRNPLSS